MTADDLIGSRIGEITVIEVLPRLPDYHVPLIVRCDQGHETEVMSKAAFRAIREGIRMHCRECKRAKVRACRICSDPAHVARDCPKRERPAPHRGCAACEGLSHRRRKPKCRVCGEPYWPEPPITTREILEQPHDGGGAFWT